MSIAVMQESKKVKRWSQKEANLPRFDQLQSSWYFKRKHLSISITKPTATRFLKIYCSLALFQIRKFKLIRNKNSSVITITQPIVLWIVSLEEGMEHSSVMFCKLLCLSIVVYLKCEFICLYCTDIVCALLFGNDTSLELVRY